MVGGGAGLLALAAVAAYIFRSGGAAGAAGAADVVNYGGVYAGLPENAANYLPWIMEAELKNSMPAGLLAWLIWNESRYREDIIRGRVLGRVGEVGIAQLTPRWHPYVQGTDPEDSIRYAGEFLRRMFERFGSWERAVIAYNWGEGNLANKGLGFVPNSTRDYVSAIREHGVDL